MIMQAGKYYRRPFLPLTVALIAGIAWGAEAPGWAAAALAIVLACGLALLRCIVRGTPAAVLPLVLFIGLGYLSLQPWVQPRFPDDHVSRFVNSGSWRIVGVVDARPLEFESRSQFVLRVQRLESGSDARSVSGLLRVTVSGETIDVAQGDRVALHGRIGPIRNFNNPGGFDFKRSMAYRGIWAGAFTGGDGLQLLERGAKSGVLERIDWLRSAIAARIDQAIPGPEAAVLKALVMGDPSGISPDIREAFTRTGTSHILAISGLHITIVATIAFGLFRWLLSWMPIALRHAWTRKGAAVLTLLPITLYALIAGFSPSTQRALIMVAAFLLALLAEREADLLNTLALAAILILCVQPAALFSISFQLSFAAVLAIIYAFERLERRGTSAASLADDDRAARIRRGLAAFFGVSLAATWGTLPLAARDVLFQQRDLHRSAGELHRHPPHGLSCRGDRPGRHAPWRGERSGGPGMLPGFRFPAFAVDCAHGMDGAVSVCRDPYGKPLQRGDGVVLPLELGGVLSCHRSTPARTGCGRRVWSVGVSAALLR